MKQELNIITPDAWLKLSNAEQLELCQRAQLQARNAELLLRERDGTAAAARQREIVMGLSLHDAVAKVLDSPATAGGCQ